MGRGEWEMERKGSHRRQSAVTGRIGSGRVGAGWFGVRLSMTVWWTLMVMAEVMMGLRWRCGVCFYALLYGPVEDLFFLSFFFFFFFCDPVI